jgi:hypothetical protein
MALAMVWHVPELQGEMWQRVTVTNCFRAIREMLELASGSKADLPLEHRTDRGLCRSSASRGLDVEPRLISRNGQQLTVDPTWRDEPASAEKSGDLQKQDAVGCVANAPVFTKIKPKSHSTSQ